VSDLHNVGGRLLVLFDGHCGLCNRYVRWLLVRDKLDRIRFVPSESALVAGLLTRYGFDATEAALGPNTILAVRDLDHPTERMLTRSDAVLAALDKLPPPWPAVAGGLRLIPRLFRDLIYRLVARWRYRIWGRLNSCPLPTPEEKGRFL
jgi:predicted DCC family thiol-disulfide oxidoreductase YuxK